VYENNEIKYIIDKIPNNGNIKEITNAVVELNWKIYLKIIKKKPIIIN
jgi:hypothetical protein